MFIEIGDEEAMFTEGEILAILQSPAALEEAAKCCRITVAEMTEHPKRYREPQAAIAYFNARGDMFMEIAKRLRDEETARLDGVED